MPPDNSIAVLRLESGPSRAKQYMEHIMLDVAIQEILDPLKKMYTELGAAQSFIDSIKIEKPTGFKVELVIEHPIAQWLEYGTDPHEITAAEFPYLHFQYRKTSKWFDSVAKDSGDWVKKFKIDHPGFPGYQLLAIMLSKLSQNYVKKVIEKTNAWLQRSKMR